MKIVFSLHALRRMEERFITRRSIMRALAAPDTLEQSVEDKRKFLAKKIYFNSTLEKRHLLLVIYKQEDVKITIITIIDTSKIKKYF